MTARRYLLCCEHYPPSIGGVQEVMRQIAERLVRRGHAVTVATSAHPQRPAEAWIEGVRVVSFAAGGNAVRGLQGQVSSYRDFLSREPADAILIKAAQQWTFDAAVQILPIMRCRKVFIPCGFSGLRDPTFEAYFQEMPRWLRLFDDLIFYSSTYQDIDFARSHGLTRLHVVSNGVDEREFANNADDNIRQRLNIDPGHDLLLSVGSLISAKGHWEVLRSFATADLARPATLVINGNIPSGPRRARLWRTIKNLMSGRFPLTWEARRLYLRRHASQRRRIVLTDLPRAELVALYKAADLFVFGSHIEYSPLVLFEAAAGGTPFISSDVGNAREIKTWLNAGTIVPGSPSIDIDFSGRLARAIALQLADLESLKRAGLAARTAVFSRGFTWSSIVEEYERILTGETTELAAIQN